MPRGILVGLDGSHYTDAAVDLGIKWAKHFDCLLIGIGVIDEPAIRGPEPINAVAGHCTTVYENMMSDARRQVEARLEKFALQASQAGVSHKLLEDVGVPYEEILREAERYDLIMLGQQTYFHFETKSGAGDTIQRVLRGATRPVIAVPEEPGSGSGILVSYDGSPEAARALAAFQASGLHELGEVHVMSVDEESSLTAAKTVNRAVEYLDMHGIRAQAKPMVSLLPPGRVILEEAQNQNMELIVMGAKGKSKLWELFFGSVTDRALHESRVPLFMYR